MKNKVGNKGRTQREDFDVCFVRGPRQRSEAASINSHLKLCWKIEVDSPACLLSRHDNIDMNDNTEGMHLKEEAASLRTAASKIDKQAEMIRSQNCNAAASQAAICLFILFFLSTVCPHITVKYTDHREVKCRADRCVPGLIKVTWYSLEEGLSWGHCEGPHNAARQEHGPDVCALQS